MNKTAELVKSLALRPEFTKLTEHEQRLEKVLEAQVVQRGWIDKFRVPAENFKDLGFYFLVSPKFALKFKNHASILGDCVGRFYSNDWGRKETKEVFHYVGDIPDLVLDKIEFIKTKYSIPIISVHSMAPLPIRVEKRLPKIDPVAILWNVNPLFDKTLYGWRSWRDTIGAVIGIWDGDKEIEVL